MSAFRNIFLNIEVPVGTSREDKILSKTRRLQFSERGYDRYLIGCEKLVPVFGGSVSPKFSEEIRWSCVQFY